MIMIHRCYESRHAAFANLAGAAIWATAAALPRPQAVEKKELFKIESCFCAAILLPLLKYWRLMALQ